MSSAPDKHGALEAFLYDLVMQGPPEMFFIGHRRRKLIAPLSGLILEIGAGTGLSIRYYSPRAIVIATEPDLASLERLARRARRVPARAGDAKAHVLAVGADAMRLPFPDATFDGLVCNLALCTIPDPRLALSEARRVLKPGAPARFLEHVRADRAWNARLQDFLAPAWYKLADGCRLNQDTEDLVTHAGFQLERVEKYRGVLLPMKAMWARC